jgi:site-specific recombinase XerD
MGKGVSQNVVWYVVRTCCEKAGLEHIAPHDLRQSAAVKSAAVKRRRRWKWRLAKG